MLIKIKEAIFTPKFSLRNIILSLFLGFLVAYLTLMIMYGASDASYVIKSIFVGDFYDSKSIARLMDKIVILGFAGMSVLVGMKAGLLNIGVSGQMMFGAFVGYFVVRQMGTTDTGAILVVGFLVTVITAAFIAMISGVLKAYFKVNEVITTIMMNWIVVYAIKYFAQNKSASWYDSNNTDKIQLSQNHKNIDTVDPSNILGIWYLAIIGIVLFISAALILWFVIYKTSYGFKMQAVGMSQAASEYSGYNVKLHQILSMTLSGAFAGMAGFSMYFLSKNYIIVGSAPIQEGFSGIAVALVAMNNPLALLASAVVFGLLDGPTDGIVFGGFPSSIVQIFAGVITYFVAISTLWIYLRPIQKYRDWKLIRNKPISNMKGVK